jgi:succinate dehydrogenase flavin-adding protein (antitoxin of CptAB toxin-antitoxin module)
MKQILQQLENQTQMRYKRSYKTILQQLDADIYAVEEVSDDALLAQMVSEMNDYSFI